MQNVATARALTVFEARVDSFDFHAAMLRSDLFAEQGLTLADEFTELEHLNVLADAVTNGLDLLGMNAVVELTWDSGDTPALRVGVALGDVEFVRVTGDFSFTVGSWNTAVVGFRATLLNALNALLAVC